LKWFKHYTNAHKGSVLQHLSNDFSINEAYALYFRFVEYLSDKWDGSSEPKFTLNERELKKYLTVSQRKFDCFLIVMQKQLHIEFTKNRKLIDISFPKLREVLHKDALSSKDRPASGPPNSRLDKNKRKKKNNTIADWASEAFDSLVASYKKEFPGTETGASALSRFVHHAKTPEISAEIVGSVTHYKKFLTSLTWERSPKTSVANYLGAKDKPFWIEYRTAKATAVSQGAGSMRGE
jgi:hypothetical protein